MYFDDSGVLVFDSSERLECGVSGRERDRGLDAMITCKREQAGVVVCHLQGLP